MSRRAATVGLAALGLAGAGLFAARRHLLARAFDLPPATHDFSVTHHIPVPMPDGATLYADRLSPRGPGPFPTILVRTPYGRPAELRLLGPFGLMGAQLFAERGYHVLIQGTRGRYRSEGRFEPFVQEAADGQATLAWIGGQPWFDGNLGMWGASYVGYTQWAVAADAPPFLKAIVPVVTSTRFSRLFYPEGSFAFESSLRWAYLVHAMVGEGGDLDLPAFLRISPSRIDAILEKALAHRPLRETDRLALGQQVEFFQHWLHDTNPDSPYWRSVDHHRTLGRVSVPVHLVAGWYDIFLNGQLADYAALLAAGRTPYLTILPRAHMDRALTIDAVREGLWWFEAHLKGRRELLDRRPVHLYLMGSNERHEMDYWPPPATITRWYLHAGAALSTTAPTAPEPADELNELQATSAYYYDPHDPTPAIGGPALSQRGGPQDQRPLEARPDVLTFTSAPLSAALDVIGHVRLELFVRSSHAHTDFVGRLCRVLPNGRSLNICEGIYRVAPGKGDPQPDGSLRIEIDLWATGQRFHPGERVRLHICSAGHPRWSAHPGDASPLASGTPGERAHQTIYHDPTRPSALVLPEVRSLK